MGILLTMKTETNAPNNKSFTELLTYAASLQTQILGGS